MNEQISSLLFTMAGFISNQNYIALQQDLHNCLINLRGARELRNQHDPYAVALTKDGGITIGHISREISRVTNYFLLHGGIITAEVKSTRPRVSPIEQGGLEIEVTVRATASEEMLDIFEQEYGRLYDTISWHVFRMLNHLIVRSQKVLIAVIAHYHIPLILISDKQ